MAHELAQAEEYVPMEVWRAMVDWLAFLFHIFLRIVPSVAHIGLPQSLLSSSSSSSSFKPLPVAELPLTESSQPSAAYPANVSGVVNDGVGDDRLLDKLTVVLDLDETLVSAYETSSLPAIVRTQAINAGLKWFELECISSDKECEGKPKVSYVTVFERPGLHEFLKQISEFADLILFTAGLEDYARPVVDKIDMENRFCLRLYRPSTVNTEFREHVKDLSCLSKDLCRTVIVDNNPFSFLLQPRNGIPCIPFSSRQPYDEQLVEILLPLLKHLSVKKDVRPILHERFRMPEWFQMHGIPSSSSMMQKDG